MFSQGESGDRCTQSGDSLGTEHYAYTAETDVVFFTEHILSSCICFLLLISASDELIDLASSVAPLSMK